MSNVPWVNTGSATDPCCCTCCLYPWPDPDAEAGGPFYPPEDLPDTIILHDPTLGAVTLTHVVGEYKFLNAGISSDYYIFAQTGGDPFWNAGPDATFFGGGPCLITGGTANGNTEDEFPDTLTVNGTDAITRDPLTNLCTWSGGLWTLRYNSTTYKFELNGTAKTDPQNEPTGNFSGNIVS